MKPIWLRMLPYVGAVLLVSGVLLGVYLHGLSVKDAEWRLKWSDRDNRDAAAKAANEAAEREKEQARQQSINKVIQNGQQIIDQATADADAARISSGSLRNAVDDLARRLAASQSRGDSCAASASKAATHSAMVLADVLKRVDQRAGELAAIADQARARGVTCERAYDALGD